MIDYRLASAASNRKPQPSKAILQIHHEVRELSLSIPLELLEVGEPAVVESFCCDENEVHRLREMGLEPGVEVEMMRSGSPCIVRVGQKRLCMRCDELSEILVTSNPTDCESARNANPCEG